MVVAQPGECASKKRRGLAYEVLVPPVAAGHIVPAWGRPVRALNEKAKMRLDHGRKEHCQWRALDASNALLLGVPVLFQRERQFGVSGETAIVDGTGLEVPDGPSALFLIVDRSSLVVRGFELRNYSTAERNIVPAGVLILGASHHVEVSANHIHDIETRFPGAEA